MATLKGEVLALCKEIANKFENWEFSSEQFKNKSLKHTTLIVGPGLGFRRVGSRGEVTVFPGVYLNNKKTMLLCKKILGRQIYTSSVFFEEIRCELNMLPE
ncbi:hypothetical protein, partial [Komagataeibacter xylinus]